jgi:hypothetical protein
LSTYPDLASTSFLDVFAKPCPPSAKTVTGLRKMRHSGLPKIDCQFPLAMAAYDLVRLPKLLAQPVA